LCNASSGPMINTTRVRAGWVWTYSTQASLSRPHEFPTPELFVGNDGGVGSILARLLAKGREYLWLVTCSDLGPWTKKFVHREGGSQVYLLITGDSTGLSLRLNGRKSCTSVLPELVSYLSMRIDRAVITTQNITVLKTYSISKKRRYERKKMDKYTNKPVC